MGHLKVNDQSTPQFINDDGSILEIKNIDQAWKIICDECHDKDSHIGYTYAIPKNIGVSVEYYEKCDVWCGGSGCVPFQPNKEKCSGNPQKKLERKLAILTPKPESVPSCGDGWISVKDQLPKDEVCYLVAGDYNAPIGYIELAQFNEIELDGSHWISGGFAVFPTHWMPLPKAPTKH